MAGEQGAYASAGEGADSSCMQFASVQLGPFVEWKQDTGIKYMWESKQMTNLIPGSLWVFFFGYWRSF